MPAPRRRCLPCHMLCYSLSPMNATSMIAFPYKDLFSFCTSTSCSQSNHSLTGHHTAASTLDPISNSNRNNQQITQTAYPKPASSLRPADQTHTMCIRWTNIAKCRICNREIRRGEEFQRQHNPACSVRQIRERYNYHHICGPCGIPKPRH